MRSRILLVARDPDLRVRLAQLFRMSGHAVELAESVAQARRVDFCLIAGAVVAPKGLGAEAPALTRELRAVTKLLLVSAASSPETGDQTHSVADEASLLAWAADGLQPYSKDTEDVLQFSNYNLDPAGHSVTDKTGAQIPLTRGEFRLLREFVQRPGRVLTRDVLLTATAGRDAESFDRSIDVLIMRLRRKIEPDPKRPSLIVTVPGIGYKFAAKVIQAVAAAPVEAPDVVEAIRPPADLPATPERRHLTILQCILSGPGFLAARQDPEDLHTLLAAFHERCKPTITAAGGTVARTLGDGILAYFGYPKADEHQAERAIRAGLALIESLGRTDLDHFGRLEACIGIASGLVVMGGLSGPSGELAVSGEAVFSVAQLASCAEANTVLIADTTRRLVGGLFHCRQRAPLFLSDAIEPIVTWTVESAAASVSRFDSTHAAHLSPFIGRDAELALLMDRWRLAQAGEGQVVLLCGEPGIGKSRILKELLDHLDTEQVGSIRLQCSPHAVNSAYYPIIDNLERALEGSRGNAPATGLDQLEALIVGRYGRPRGDVRFIASILSVPWEEQYGALAISPQKFKDETLRTLADIVEAAARSQPTIMLFEDVHWADPTSLETVDRLIDRLARIPLLLIMTHRPEFQSRWSGHGNLTAVALPRLTKTQSARLASDVSRGRSLPPDLLEEILERTDGVPLFVEEVTKAALESVAFEDAGKPYHDPPGVASGPTLPLTLHASLMARLDRQGSVVRDVAQTAAVIGREFGYPLLASTTDLPEPQLRQAMDRLVDAGLVFARGTPPEASYLFKHALVRDAAYGSLLRHRRQVLHRRIVATLEQHSPDVAQAQPALLAQHCTDAGLAEQAVAYWLKAGRQAAARLAYAEAIVHLERGLAVLSSLPEGPARDRQEVELQLVRGLCIYTARGPVAARPAYIRAHELAAEQGSSPQQFEALYGVWQCHLVSGGIAAARPFSEQLVRMSEREQDPGLRLQSYHSEWSTLVYAGEVAKGREYADAGRRIYDVESHQAHRLVFGGHDPGVCAGCMSALAEWLMGYPDTALASSAEALALSRRIAHPFTSSVALILASLLHLSNREPEEALKWLDTAEALATEQRLSLIAEPNLLRGAALVGQGAPEQAIIRIEQALREMRRRGGAFYLPFGLAFLADAFARRGQHPAAAAAIREGLEAAGATGAHVWDAELHRIHGIVLLAENKADGGEAALREALRVARAQQARTYELRAATCLARVWDEQGRRTQARNLLAPIYGWFTEGFNAPDLKDAKTLLDHLT
jgi:DNA-binding response OmpR family regulator/class 3 adenylate cyclase/tetratricopeptide (TPR) repeat protein